LFLDRPTTYPAAQKRAMQIEPPVSHNEREMSCLVRLSSARFFVINVFYRVASPTIHAIMFIRVNTQIHATFTRSGGKK
jgi:hypothetical protein